MVETKPNKYERSRRVLNKPNKINRLLNPYHKIRETVNTIRNNNK